jgi:hypothetical protein
MVQGNDHNPLQQQQQQQQPGSRIILFSSPALRISNLTLAPILNILNIVRALNISDT